MATAERVSSSRAHAAPAHPGPQPDLHRSRFDVGGQRPGPRVITDCSRIGQIVTLRSMHWSAQFMLSRRRGICRVCG